LPEPSAALIPGGFFELAPHCCQLTHHKPHWSATAGRVLAEEIVTFQGLEVQRRTIAYGNLHPKEATEIFIRSALVEEELIPRPGSGPNAGSDDLDELRVLTPVPTKEPKLPPQYRFLEHNRAVRQRIENWRTRVRHYGLGDLDQALFDFYAKRIENVSSRDELNRLLSDRSDPDSLCITESDFSGGQVMGYDSVAFPDTVSVNGQPVSIAYAYAPGEDHDGVTIQLPFTLAQTVSSALLEWAVPGLRAEIIGELLRSLPKALRRELMPFPPRWPRSFVISNPQVGCFARISHDSFTNATALRFRRPRGQPTRCRRICAHASRSSTRTRGRLPPAAIWINSVSASNPVKIDPTQEPPAWQQAAKKWECFALAGWNFGDLPERVTVSEGPGLPLYAWPGLQFEEGNVNVRIFRSQDGRARRHRDRSFGASWNWPSRKTSVGWKKICAP